MKQIEIGIGTGIDGVIDDNTVDGADESIVAGWLFQHKLGREETIVRK